MFAAIATPKGLDAWWTMHSSGAAQTDAVWQLGFGPEYNWHATITICEPNRAIEWTLTDAMEDWLQTRVGFRLAEAEGVTTVEFYHRGWAEPSKHFCISSYCWATYLRLLKRYVERGEVVSYTARDEA
ncbi:MAG: SRPBCC domain-containing protein [Acidobacteria bacterium]|nr:SRPBCC domain-containing protein [Acidobacteriota bacterium]